MKLAYSKPVFRELGTQPPQFTWIRARKHRIESRSRKAMLENLGLVLALICILAGFPLLSDSSADANSGARLLGGAALLNAGLITAWIAAKSKLAWWRAAKEMREERGQILQEKRR